MPVSASSFIAAALLVASPTIGTPSSSASAFVARIEVVLPDPASPLAQANRLEPMLCTSSRCSGVNA